MGDPNKETNNKDIPVVSLIYKERFLKYLDMSGHLKHIKNVANNYKKIIDGLQKIDRYEIPLLIVLEIDIIWLTDISAFFSSLLLTEPDIARNIIHEVVHCAASTLGDIPDLQYQDIQLLLRVQSLPALPGLVKTGPVGPSGLVLLQGILIAQTFPVKYNRSKVYQCQERHCEGHGGYRIQENRVQNASRCIVCGSDVKENCRARDIGDEVLGLLVSPYALKNSASEEFLRHQSILVCFQDELSTNLELGIRYDIPGVQKSSYFEAWNVQRWKSGIERKVHHPEIPFITLPSTICTLHAVLSQSCPQSPWAVVTALAAQIGFEMYPPTVLLHLKLGLLLSLASQGRNQSPVPVLAVGTDTLAAHQLLNHASHLAQRRVSVNSQSLWGPLQGTSHLDEQGKNWLEAGALLLSSTGVCFLGDWTKFKSANLYSPVLSAIESGKVTITTQKLGVPGPSIKFPLQCAVWTYQYWSPELKANEQSKLQTLIDVFGMPFLADLGNEADIVTHHILQRAINCGKNLNKPYYIVPTAELQQFLAMVTTQPVKLTDKASQLIQDYFVASRRLRSQYLPVGAISTITALSEAHASLRMRSVVNCEDVAMVLYLYEMSMMALFGPCYVTPPPELQTLDTEDLPLQMHKHLLLFIGWLEKHIKSLIGGMSYNIKPEE